jgi:ribosome-associated heat shock protein Hsp15
VNKSDADPVATRLDKWLWAARFFKTRQLAVDAIAAGRVEVNGERVKPAKTIKPGDRLFLRKPPLEYHLAVSAVAGKRGSAAIAKTMFTESAESIAAREKVVAELRDMPPPLFRGRPTKKDRRTLERWQRAEDGSGDGDA